ncbi:hypothetical protein N331_07873, partial [Merops nubicus]
FSWQAERESSVATQHLPPRRNICLFRSHQQPVIGGPGAGGGPAWWDGTQTQPFQQQAAELRRAMRQVRRRLASCRTVPQGSGPPELPGGIWRLEKPESCPTATVPTGDESEELLLVGHHDLPAELQGQGTAPPQAELDNDFYIKIKFGKICDASVKDSSSPEPAQKPQTHSQALLMPWDGVDQEETKKQVGPLEPSPLFISTEKGLGVGGAAGSEEEPQEKPSAPLPAGLRARRRTSGRQRSRGCRGPTNEALPQVRELLNPSPSLNWRRRE